MAETRLDVRPLPFLCGVYLLYCLITGKIYVGSSGSSMRQRGYYHRGMLEAGNHDNSYLQNAYNKHGANNFEFRVLELWDDPDTVTEREQFWIVYLEATNRDKGYNLAEDATRGPMLGRHHSEETCKRLAEVAREKITPQFAQAGALAMMVNGHTSESRKKISMKLKGVPKTPEHQLKINLSRQSAVVREHMKNLREQNTGRPLTEEHKAKISAGCKGQKRTDEQKQHYSDGHWTKGPNAAEIMARRSEKMRIKREARAAAAEAEKQAAQQPKKPISLFD